MNRMDIYEADWDSGDKGRIWVGSTVALEGA